MAFLRKQGSRLPLLPRRDSVGSKAKRSFLRKQQSRLLCACYVFLLGKREFWDTFWTAACAGRQ